VRAHRRRRAADAPWVESITHVSYEGDSDDVTRPDGCWDLVVLKQARQKKLLVLQTGVITQPVKLPYQAGDEYLCISFKPGVFVPGVAADRMVDQGVVRPLTGARSFALGNESLEIPTFENVEGLVQQLVRRGLLARDEIVQRAVGGEAVFTTDRSVQRHFLRSLGVSFKALEQIRRAQRAVQLLEAGRPAADVALELGYSDQPHLIRSLRRFLGTTPGALARAR
jgi:hypothetical protein